MIGKLWTAWVVTTLPVSMLLQVAAWSYVPDWLRVLFAFSNIFLILLWLEVIHELVYQWMSEHHHDRMPKWL